MPNIHKASQLDYELIDSGNFQKLERFGNQILIRPEPQVLWNNKLSIKEWKELAHKEYVPKESHQGIWNEWKKGLSEWQIKYQLDEKKFKFKLALTQFKHIGIFPEQKENWHFIYDHCKKIQQPKVLNLFAYTGIASIVAHEAGAEVTHVEALKQNIQWAKDNLVLNSNKNTVRWIQDDVIKFVKREIRRNQQYHGIILDPPAYGNGPKGEKWYMSKHINELIELLAQLLNKEQHFFILNSYSLGYSPTLLKNLVIDHFPHAENVTYGELLLNETSSGKKLPAGIIVRFNRN